MIILYKLILLFSVEGQYVTVGLQDGLTQRDCKEEAHLLTYKRDEIRIHATLDDTPLNDAQLKIRKEVFDSGKERKRMFLCVPQSTKG